MSSCEAKFTGCCRIRFEIVRDELVWDKAILLQKLAHEFQRMFKAAAETTITIAGDPKHLDARIGITAVLHTWGSAMTHHPHVHMIVPGGGISADGLRWVSCRSSFFLPVRVLSRLFRRLFLQMLSLAYAAGRLKFHGDRAGLANDAAFAAFLAPLRKTESTPILGGLHHQYVRI
jgi:hypothetical protein